MVEKMLITVSRNEVPGTAYEFMTLNSYVVPGH